MLEHLGWSLSDQTLAWQTAHAWREQRPLGVPPCLHPPPMTRSRTAAWTRLQTTWAAMLARAPRRTIVKVGQGDHSPAHFSPPLSTMVTFSRKLFQSLQPLSVLQCNVMQFNAMILGYYPPINFFCISIASTNVTCMKLAKCSVKFGGGPLVGGCPHHVLCVVHGAMMGQDQEGPGGEGGVTVNHTTAPLSSLLSVCMEQASPWKADVISK